MKRLIRLGLFLLSAVLLTGCTGAQEQGEVMEPYAYTGDKTMYALENEFLSFSLDPATTYFQVTDKKNHTVWNSNPVEGANDEKADAESKKQILSTLLVKYSTDVGIQTTYSNYEYSIAKQVYEIEEGSDYIKVKYSIGDVEKVFIYPEALPESKMQIYLNKMDDSQKKQIDSYYRKYDVNKLRASDNKEELLIKYPDLETEKVYVIRDNLQEYISIKLEEVFDAAGYTMADFEEDSHRYEKGEAKQKPFYNISVVYRLDNEELIVEVPFEEMQWPHNYPLIEVTVLPYFCSGSAKEEGYLFVPEGTGGIIEFNNGKVQQNPYYAQVYGWDNGMKRDSLVDESRVAFPVYGIAKNNSAMLCFMEEYNTLATLSADVSGRKHSYNYVNASYTTLHSASVQVSAKSDRSVMVYEAEKPEGAIRQRYRFFGTDSYSEMAGGYRDYLIEKYNLVRYEKSGVPVNITLIGAIDAVKQRFGFPVSVPVPLTTYEEAKNILMELMNYGYQNVSVRYSGMINGGIKQTILQSVKPVSELGSRKELKAYLSYAKENDIAVFLDSVADYTYKGGLFDGFSVNRDASKYPSREVVKLYDFSPVWFGEKDWIDSYYVLKPQLAVSGMQNVAKAGGNFGTSGIAFRDIGYTLNADYNPKNLLTREKVAILQQEALKEIRAVGQKIMVKGGNEYVLSYTDFIVDMELTGNPYQIIDYGVPFYTIALHGLLPYTGTSLNLSNNYTDMVLKSAETGAGLSFTFMKEPVALLQNTNYTYYFGADYDKWKEEAYTIYNRYEAELGGLFNQFITGHERLAEGVFVTSYEGGTRVFVNYSNADYTEGTLKVPARDYKVEGR
ncbi:hypothetical protein acsn021_15900 [Anaerocolumna cellulosilytica]|uniref:Uncharacterized protein n=1 Tax=Anaerocolumna cellulosilytica TaxID=433286 RepID=A0A6S6R4J7_9FIRM|nr:DUF5696 domain-containing protein [Anaerocolumna cellulosilytica]MBB5197213.1 hypothetical protein [Anaerocolumna cellulosilytica]BCJ94021.1 hypothetical protein acsn021_15900 [Anaerocolumna cellulosilytica]